jgi:hypothetical protein
MDQISSRPCIDSKNYDLFQIKLFIGSPISRTSFGFSNY